jgi:[acyl-carrier-protein] S-malonyltransferase
MKIMSKLAFVFPGQGSQEVGMGEDLVKNYKEADELFNAANMALKDMQTATPLGTGSMTAIISLHKDKIEELIKKTSKSGIIEIANYNSPYQIVVSGKSEVIDQLLILGEEEKEINIIPLRVSAPFHSSLMRRAKDNLASYIEVINIQDPQIPVICNVTAEYVKTKEEIKDALIEQVTHPIRWVEIVKRINSEGINCFIEVGPGNVLKKLIKQILPKAKVYNVFDSEKAAHRKK